MSFLQGSQKDGYVGFPDACSTRTSLEIGHVWHSMKHLSGHLAFVQVAAMP